MKTSSLSKTDPSTCSWQYLRLQKEAKPGRQKSASAPLMEAYTLRLIKELQIHQIELEMQNEELVQAREATEAALRQYTELYDFAPVGYFTLAGDGTISKANLYGAGLLGVDRGKLIHRRFDGFVADPSRKTFDVVARIGGDEFAVLLPATEAATAKVLLERVHQVILDNNIAYPETPIRFSMGISTAEHPMPLTVVLKNADANMYREKRGNDVT
jgi:hypothetical protein